MAPSSFGAVEEFESALLHTDTDPAAVILKLVNVPFIDLSGLVALQDAVEALGKRGVVVALCCANPTWQRSYGRRRSPALWPTPATATLAESVEAVCARLQPSRGGEYTKVRALGKMAGLETWTTTAHTRSQELAAVYDAVYADWDDIAFWQVIAPRASDGPLLELGCGRPHPAATRPGRTRGHRPRPRNHMLTRFRSSCGRSRPRCATG